MTEPKHEELTIEQLIGRRIQHFRAQLGPQVGSVSQADLGARLGEYLAKPWPRQSISNAEGGHRAFTAVELVALSKVLGVTVANLLEPLPGTRVAFPSGAEWVPESKAVGEFMELSNSIYELERAAMHLRNQKELFEASAKLEQVILTHVDKAYDALHRVIDQPGEGE